MAGIKCYILFSLFTLLLLPVPMPAMTADGFITRIDSSTAFDLGALHVILADRTRCEARLVDDTDSPFDSWKPSDAGKWTVPRDFEFSRSHISTQVVATSCNKLHLMIGSAVQLFGVMQPNTQYFMAKSIVLNSIPGLNTFDGVALIEETPERSRTAQGLGGEIWLDGYPVRITPQSKLLTAPGNTLFLPILNKDGTLKTGDVAIPGHMNVTAAEVPAAMHLRGNTWVRYHAKRMVDGSITATYLRVWPNRTDVKGEMHDKKFAVVINAPDYNGHAPGTVKFQHEKTTILPEAMTQELYDKKFSVNINEPDYSRHTPGTIKFQHEKATILPDGMVQSWVSELGMGLVPQYQKSLSDDDPTKVHFHFYVIRPFTVAHFHDYQNIDGLNCAAEYSGYFYGNPRRHAIVKDVIAMQNGTILIPESALHFLDSQSQLAALLSYAITSILQQQFYHLWLITTYIPGAKLSDMSKNDFNLCALITRLNEQALRIGIRQMYLAGHDIREAPFAWAVAQGKPVNNPVIDSKDPDKEIPWYAAYAFNYISQYYRDVDYSKLKRGQAEYQQFLEELRKADPEAFAPQNADSRHTAKVH